MIRPSIFRKLLIASLLMALLPLLTAALLLFSGLEQVRDKLALEISSSAEQQAAEGLQMRARQVAESITDFLNRREDDLRFLSLFTTQNKVLLSFWQQHRSQIWERRKNPDGTVVEVREWLPLYRSFALIDASGQEQMVLKDGRFLTPAELRNVSRPEQTEFKSETYFSEIMRLLPGEIHVTRVTGFHVNKHQQLAGADEPEHAYDVHYQGVIRFGTPLHDAEGRLIGAFVISLDHRHLMEFTQHIDPGPRFSTVFPSYKSGNYAFLFDDEGWIITHPKLWDIRGVDQQGRLVPPYTRKSTLEEITLGTIPFNLDHAAFIHPNYPVASSLVRQQKYGVVELTNVGGSRKIMAYAPILYSTGPYRKHGIFGGVTIGYQVDQFQQQASVGSRLITTKLKEYRRQSSFILLVTVLIAALAAWLLARGISRPLQRLRDGVRKLQNDDTGSRVPVTGDDELAELATSFNAMAAELEQRKSNLIATLEQLQESRQAILDERNFKESILESISSAITTFSSNGELTSCNSTAERFLGQHWPLGSHYAKVFDSWGDLPARIGRAFSEAIGYGREPLPIQRNGQVRHFDVGIFPIGSHGEKGLTVTLRDETVREDLREETFRLDRLASLGRLAAGISHEIRNPLTGISLLLDDLHDRADLADDERLLLRKAMDEIERIERLTTAMLSFASPPKACFRPARLDEVVQEVTLLLSQSCRKQGITLQVNCARFEPVMLDADRIRQAVLNLLKNSQEVLPKGGTITLALRHADTNTAELIITDSGPGIAPEDLPLIFEPFFTRKGAGTGLGLSITKRIFEEHGAVIRVDSAPAQGTSFRISLPLILPDGAELADQP